MKKLKIVFILLALMLLGAFFYFGGTDYLSLESLKARQTSIQLWTQDNYLLAIAGFLLIYVFATALSLPGATILTLAGGALFGLVTGTILVSLASTTGATLAFWLSRFVFRDSVKSRFPDAWARVNKGVEKEGAFYLFTLRLVPAFPFFVINILMGLTKLRTRTFFLVSQLGMLPGTLAYVNAGTQLSQVESLRGILSTELIVSFAVIGLLPLIARKVIQKMRGSRQTKNYKKPKTFDFNTIVIGGGSAGLVSAYISAALKARVALIEKHKMGGDCLNTGCVPSKALIKTAKIVALSRKAESLGLKSLKPEFDFQEVMARVHQTIGKIEPHDSVERYSSLGVECITGEAYIQSPYEVRVNNEVLTTKNIIVATGAGPLVPNIPGLEKVRYLTSDTFWQMQTQPKTLLVIGGGPIGCELAQAMQRLGTQVTIIEAAPQILSKEDPEAARLVHQSLEADGVRILTGLTVSQILANESAQSVIAKSGDGVEQEIEFDEILLALGRKANVKGFGLEELGVKINEFGRVEANEFMETNYPGIFVAGDVTSHLQFTHMASHQAWYASVNALFRPLKKFKADYRVVPRCTYTSPEVASVGLTEIKAKQRGIAYTLVRYGIDDLDRAIIEGEAEGFVKVLVKPGSDKILGATIAHEHAGEILAELTLAMRHNLGLGKILSTVHAYPTLSEANKYAAGVWKKSTAPETALRILSRFHRWRRGAPSAESKIHHNQNEFNLKES